MNLKGILSYLWKLPVCGLAFVLGSMIGSMLATAIGLQSPAIPEGTEPGTLILLQLLASPILALALSLVSRGIQGRFLTRWLILSFLTWVAYGVNTLLEAALFTTSGAASLFTAVMWLVGSFTCGALVAWLFPPKPKPEGFAANLKAFLAHRDVREWAWRLPVASVAFMPIYLFFGRLVVPFTYEYYRQNLLELTAPGWGQILPVLFVRSILFLVVSLPVFITWQESRRSLFLSLGFAMFVLVGALGLMLAYWLPLSLRLIHGLEILTDSLVYAWVLVVLLAKKPMAIRDR